MLGLKGSGSLGFAGRGRSAASGLKDENWPRTRGWRRIHGRAAFWSAGHDFNLPSGFDQLEGANGEVARCCTGSISNQESNLRSK